MISWYTIISWVYLISGYVLAKGNCIRSIQSKVAAHHFRPPKAQNSFFNSLHSFQSKEINYHEITLSTRQNQFYSDKTLELLRNYE